MGTVAANTGGAEGIETGWRNGSVCVCVCVLVE
jgi:hypothetical protein